jgi:iron complex outermembrane receptor protein
MSRERNLRAGTVFCGCAAGMITLVSMPAYAQNASESGAASESTSGDIIVTATRRAERQRDVALGISVLGTEQLEKQQLRSFADYVPLVPGLSLQATSPTVNRVTIRGLNAGGAGASVGIYVDDSPVGSSNGLAGGAVYTANSDTWDLQRVEVLRGPQGTLYGANTEGGLIKFVSNAPDLSKYSGVAQVGGEAVDGGNVRGSARGVANFMLRQDVAAFRISGFYDGLPGFIDNAQLGVRDINGGRRWGVRGSLLVKPVEDLSIRLTGFYQDTRVGAAPSIDVIGNAASYAAPPADQLDPAGRDLTQNSFLRQPYQSDITNVSATIEWSAPWATLTSISTYNKTHFNDLQDVTSATVTYDGVATPEAPLGRPITYGAFGQAFVYGVPVTAEIRSMTPLEKLTQEVRIASKPSTRFEWLVGGFATRETANLNQQYAFRSIATGAELSPIAGGTQLRSKYEEFAAYGSATFKFSPRFDIEVGGRYAHNKQSNDNLFQPGLFSGGPFTTHVDSDENVFTYSVAPRFKVNADTLIYARVASGFKPGGPNNVTVPGPLPAGYPLQYGSEKTTNYELGVRSKLFDNLLSVDVALFDIEWDNIQVITRFGNFNVRTNGGKARSRGIEWAFELRPVRGLDVALTGSYVDAQIKGSLTEFGLDGQRLPYVPDLTAAVNATYSWRFAGDFDASIGGTYAYTGTRTTGLGALVTNPVVRLPDYGTLALRASIGNGDWRADFYVKNVTDSRGISTYIGSGAPDLRGSKIVINPRTFGITLTKSFR